jgi:hypothetical protein
MLLLTTLSTSECKKIVLPEVAGGVLRCAAVASNGSLARAAEGLGLFLLPNGRPGVVLPTQKKKKLPWKPLWVCSCCHEAGHAHASPP